MLTRTATVVTHLGESALLLYAMRARETLSRPFSYELELLSTDENVDLSALLGQPVSVNLELSDGSVREFTGIAVNLTVYARAASVQLPQLGSRVRARRSLHQLCRTLFLEQLIHR